MSAGQLACGPLSLRNVGTPFLPVLGTITIFLEAPLLLSEELVAFKDHHGGNRSLSREVVWIGEG